jgi:hypothetical protein
MRQRTGSKVSNIAFEYSTIKSEQLPNLGNLRNGDIRVLIPE